MGKAYGQITLTSLTDVGQFSVITESNTPLIQVYDPNSSSYTPSWSTDNVTLKPVAYYASSDVSSSLASVTWTRKDGSGAETSLITGEAKVGNNLVVSANLLGSASTGIISYICTATYTNASIPDVTLTAKSQITFSLTKLATNLKLCDVTGDIAFLYNSSQSIVGTGIITLTGRLSNCSVSAWQYKNSSGGWTTYPTDSTYNTSITTETLIVLPTSAAFIDGGDTATIKLQTSDASVFDIHTVVKLRDGAPGESTIAAVLSNEDQMIPCNSAGTPTSGAFAEAVSTMYVYEGGTDVTARYTITAVTTNCAGTLSGATYTVSSLSADAASVTLTATLKTDSSVTLSKKFTLTKIKTGADGANAVTYSLSASSLVLNKNISNVFNPTTITFSCWSKTGASDRVAYLGRLKIYENGTAVTIAALDNNVSSYTYTPTTAATILKCELYAAGGTTTLYDSVTVAVTKDGATGGTGAAGSGAYGVILGNQADIIPCTVSGATKSAMTINVPFSSYKGISRIAATAAVTGLPSGITSATTASSTTADGKVTLTVASGSTLGGALSGQIQIAFTADSTVISTQYYSWSKSIQSSDAVLMQLTAPNGNVITDTVTSVTLKALILSGSTEVTASNYIFKKYEDGSYVQKQSGASATFTVADSDVDSLASYQCIATYNSTDYTAYFSVFDKHDPVSVDLFSTVGNQLVNGIGVGAIYPRVYKNGIEVDAMKKSVAGVLQISATEPSSKVSGDYWYFVDAANKSVKLRKYSGSAWSDVTASEPPSGTYAYTFIDSSGASVQYNGSSSYSGKVLYVDGTLISSKLIFNLEVTI